MIDVAIVGGSFAGLSAALQLGRARRSVMVFDTGLNRNRFTPAAHGLLGLDGRSPAELLSAARADVAAYPTVTFQQLEIVSAEPTPDGFILTDADGGEITARRIILANGISDELPAIPGLGDLWGKTVFHCPYCHGYEVRDQPLASIAPSIEMIGHLGMLLDWSEDVTVLTNGVSAELDPASRLKIDTRPIDRIAATEQGAIIHFREGSPLNVGGIHVLPINAPNGTLHTQLNCELADSPLGSRVKVGEFLETTTERVFAAGDNMTGMANLAIAIANGALAGTSAHRSLLFDPAGAIHRTVS